MKTIALTLLVLVGCLDMGPEAAPVKLKEHQWAIGTTPVGVLGDNSQDPTWTHMVDVARAKWSIPLIQMGCVDPFEGVQTQPVILVPDSAWLEPTAIGVEWADQIWIKGTVDEMQANQAYTTVLPHELGHALGLPHSPEINSVMHDPNITQEPSMRDLQNAAKNIGCSY